MIQRKNNINPDAAEVSFMVSYTAYDVWSWLHYYAGLYHLDNPENYDYAFGTIQSTNDIIYYLTHEPKCLGWMVEKNARPIAEWAITIATKQGYLISDGCGYRLSRRLAKKNGRPKENT